MQAIVDWVIGDARICGDKWKIWSEARTKEAKKMEDESLQEGLIAW